MPTHILRNRKPAPEPGKVPRTGRSRHGAAHAMPARVAIFRIGPVDLRVELAPSHTAERFWAMLPLYSKAEPWGQVIHFEIPVEIGRDRSARLNARPGEIYLWAEEDRILLPFGPSPISRNISPTLKPFSAASD